MIFGQNNPPSFVANDLEIMQGAAAIVGNTTLGAMDVDSDESQLMFTVSSVQQGQFELVSSPGMSIMSFIQQEVMDGEIQFVHDDSSTAPSYALTVSDPFNTVGPVTGGVTFNARPVLTANELTLEAGETVFITSSELSATDVDDIDNDEELLSFTVSDVAQGQFELLSNPGVAVTNFQQGAITNGEVQFVSSGDNAPSYEVSVSDGVLSSQAQAATVNFSMGNGSGSGGGSDDNTALIVGTTVGGVVGLLAAGTLAGLAGYGLFRYRKQQKAKDTQGLSNAEQLSDIELEDVKSQDAVGLGM